MQFVFVSLSGYSILWQNKKIYVYRADVMCTNGIIHVIDRPFIEESDVKVTYVSAATANSFSLINVILIPNIVMFLLTKLFV